MELWIRALGIGALLGLLGLTACFPLPPPPWAWGRHDHHERYEHRDYDHGSYGHGDHDERWRGDDRHERH
jgi:hypothetical protein